MTDNNQPQTISIFVRTVDRRRQCISSLRRGDACSSGQIQDTSRRWAPRHATLLLPLHTLHRLKSLPNSFTANTINLTAATTAFRVTSAAVIFFPLHLPNMPVVALAFFLKHSRTHQSGTPYESAKRPAADNLSTAFSRCRDPRSLIFVWVFQKCKSNVFFQWNILKPLVFDLWRTPTSRCTLYPTCVSWRVINITDDKPQALLFWGEGGSTAEEMNIITLSW